MTLSAPHTPGPYAVLPVEPDKSYVRVRGTQLGCRYKIADVPFVRAGDTELAALEQAEAEANARLFAASPDLLAALRKLLTHSQELRGVPLALRTEAAAAIAKATEVPPGG